MPSVGDAMHISFTLEACFVITPAVLDPVVVGANSRTQKRGLHHELWPSSPDADARDITSYVVHGQI